MEEKRREAAAAYESRKPELEDQIRRMQDALSLYAEQEKKRQAYETLEHQRTALTQNLKKCRISWKRAVHRKKYFETRSGRR